MNIHTNVCMSMCAKNIHPLTQLQLQLMHQQWYFKLIPLSVEGLGPKPKLHSCRLCEQYWPWTCFDFSYFFRIFSIFCYFFVVLSFFRGKKHWFFLMFSLFFRDCFDFFNFFVIFVIFQWTSTELFDFSFFFLFFCYFLCFFFDFFDFSSGRPAVRALPREPVRQN